MDTHCCVGLGETPGIPMRREIAYSPLGVHTTGSKKTNIMEKLTWVRIPRSGQTSTLGLISILLAFGIALPGVSAQSQEARSQGSSGGMVAVGVGIVPEYGGASDVRSVPFVFGEIGWRGINLEFRGSGLRADLAPNPRLSFGPTIGARLPRREAEGPVGLLPEHDVAIEAGGFVGYRFGGDPSGQRSLQMEFSLVQDVSDTHDGLVATASASYVAIRRSDFSLSLDAQTTWVNGDYARTYFGVTPSDAATSGLTAYSPGAGIRDVALGVTAGYWFNQSFGVMGRIGASYLVGDTANSPITDEGSRWQPNVGIAVAYRF